MSDREKMLADLREARDAALAGNLEPAKHFVVRYREALEALLTEPSLEEVARAFCDGYLYRKSVEHRSTKTGASLVEEMAVGFKLFNDGATPTFLVDEAARECLRRVKG